MRQKGFSLIEILVLLAILAILSTTGLAIYDGIKRTAAAQEQALREPRPIPTPDDPVKYMFEGHTWIRFGYGHSVWGGHDPDCPKCHKTVEVEK